MTSGDQKQGARNGTSDEMAGDAAGVGAGAGPGGAKQPDDKVAGRTLPFAEGGPPDWDPDTTSDGGMGGGGVGGTGGVTCGASGRSNTGG